MPKATPTWTKKLVSIVVPMCNEEESIPLLRKKLERLQRQLERLYTVEYCLVDDGSTDRTGELMESVVPAGGRVAICRHAVNRGLGAALRTGMRAAQGAIVCTIDADCSYPPENLNVLIEMVALRRADVATASPYHPQGGVLGVKAWRILLSRQCSRFYRWISPLKLHTYTSIFRAYDGRVARHIRFESDGFLSAVEMLFSASGLGYSIAEVPMVLRARVSGTSKIRIARTIWAHLGMMVSLVRMGARNRAMDRQTSQSLARNVLGGKRMPARVTLREDQVEAVGEGN